MNTPQRIERAYFQYSPESAYIHKYYLAKEFYKAITRQDIDAVLYKESSIQAAKAMTTKGVAISYKDIGCEKYLNPQQATAIYDAAKAYNTDKLAILTDDELNTAIAMNERLTRLEEKIKKECIMLNKTLQERLAKGDEFLKDYEIDVKVSFYMDYNHPEYYEDNVYHDTEIMGLFKGLGKHATEKEVSKKDYQGIGDRKNYNDLRPKNADNPFFGGIPLCYLFHWYECSPMPLKHISHVGAIWTELTVDYQSKDLLLA